MDRELLEVLAADARTSVDDIARQLDREPEAVAAAIEELEDAGVIKGYSAVIDWDAVDASTVRAIVELNVELDRETDYEEIADRIARFPEVKSLLLVSGNYDFAIEVEGESMQAVSRFVSEQVAPVPEITQTVTHFVMETYKDGGFVFEDRDEDDRLSVSP